MIIKNKYTIIDTIWFNHTDSNLSIVNLRLFISLNMIINKLEY